MSTNDSAEDKLVASIRKTRTTKAAPAVVKKKTVTKKKVTAAPKTTPEDTSNKKSLVGLFQSGRRVWPD